MLWTIALKQMKTHAHESSQYAAYQVKASTVVWCHHCSTLTSLRFKIRSSVSPSSTYLQREGEREEEEGESGAGVGWGVGREEGENDETRGRGMRG